MSLHALTRKVVELEEVLGKLVTVVEHLLHRDPAGGSPSVGGAVCATPGHIADPMALSILAMNPK